MIKKLFFTFILCSGLIAGNLYPVPGRAQAQGEDPIFADSFEAGDLSGWTSNETDNGDLSVSAEAALSDNSVLQALINDSNPIYVRDDSPNAEPRYRVRFYFDPNSIEIANDDSFAIFAGYTDESTEILQLAFRRSSGNYQLRARLLNDSSDWLNSNWITISDAPHTIELDWRAATAADANDGGLTFWIDDVQQADLTQVDNYAWRTDYVQLGVLSGVDTDTRGMYYFDAFESRRQSYIGAAGSAPTQPLAATVNPTTAAVTTTQTPVAPAAAGDPMIPRAEGVVAFPGAKGFGAQSLGGRGGTVIEVTNLNDSGAGSLRACVAAQGPRICVFRVGGTITTLSKIIVTNPYLTIAGQTAPGGGVTLRAAQTYHEEPFIISTHDVVIRFVRFRAGASAVPNSSRRSLTINSGAYNVIIDHCSFSWATDQPLLLSDGVHDITIQWSIISEGLAHSTHSEGGIFQEHSTGLSVSGKNYNSTGQTGNITIHHNLLAHNGGRNPQNAGYGLEDVVNNVIYNWGGQAFTTQDLHANVPTNLVNNYFKPGPNSFSYEVKASHVNPLMTGPRIYVSGNIGPHRPDDSQPNSNIVSTDSRIYMVPTRFAAPAVTTTSALQAYQEVVTKAGTRAPMLDAVDKRVIADVKAGGGRIIDCVSANELRTPINCATRVHLTATDHNKYGIYDPIDQMGWPILAAGMPPQDNDHDGMPDSWEADGGLNPNLNESGQDQDGDGYTNIEEYLNLFASPPSVATSVSPSGSINTKTPTYTWKKVFGATHYYLWVNAPSGNGYIKQWYEASVVCGSTTCSATPAIALSSGTYPWWVRSWNFAGYGPWSNSMSFSLPDPPRATTLISPSGSTSDNTPTYTWNEVAGATWYYLWVNAPSGKGYIKQWFEASQYCTGGTCSATPSVTLGAGGHSWWIRTWNIGSYGPWSSGMDFTISP